jgi:SAM-dependent methyltransferase
LTTSTAPGRRGERHSPHASEDRLHPKLAQHSYLQLRALRAALAKEAARCGPGPVLDLGCGSKPYEPLFTNPYLGLDVAMVHGRPDCLGVAEHAPIRSGSIGTVLSTQYLEHAEDPDAVLTEARRMLRPGGRLLLSTHGVWVHHPDPHDYWRWTEEGLRTLFERHGFAVEAVHRQGELYTASLLLATYPLAAVQRSGRRVVAALASALTVVCNAVGIALDGTISRVLPRHYASASYLLVGRAPVGTSA